MRKTSLAGSHSKDRPFLCLLLGKKESHFKCFVNSEGNELTPSFQFNTSANKNKYASGDSQPVAASKWTKTWPCIPPFPRSIPCDLACHSLWGSLPIPQTVTRAGQWELGNHRSALKLQGWKASAVLVLPRVKHAHNWTWSCFVCRSGAEGVNGGNESCSWLNRNC